MIESVRFALGLLLAAHGSAASLERWSQIYPRPTGQSLRDVTSDGTNWVAVGTAGTIVVSPDGTNWSVVATGLPANRNLMSVACAADRWVTVGSGGTILSSSNATDWAVCNSGTTEILNGVTHGGGRFLAVGAYGVVISSTNGLDWTLESGSSPWSPSLQSVTYGNGLFVAGGLGTLQTSVDGAHWTPQTFEPAHDIYSVWYDGLQFLAGRYNGVVFRSPDGTNWASPGGLSATYINSFTRLGNRYLAAAGELWASEDLTNWTVLATGAYSSTSAGGIAAARATGDRMILVGEAGNLLITSDSTNFLQCRVGRPLNLSIVLAHGRQTLGFNSSGIALGSPDGWSWSEGSYGTAGFVPMDALSDGTLALVVGAYYSAPSFTANEVRISEDGRHWTSTRLRSQGGLLGVTASPGLYVAVGAAGVVHTSTNGTAWTSNAIPGRPKLNSVSAGAGRFVAVGPAGTNYTSPDAVQWTAINSSVAKELVSVAYGAQRFVAVGRTGTIITSEAGDAWLPSVSGVTQDFRRVAFVGDRFLACTSASLLMSTDGLAWSTLTNAPAGVRSISAAGDRVVIGASDYICSSTGLSPRFDGIRLTREGSVSLGVSSPAGEIYRLESTADFLRWEFLDSVTNRLGFQWIPVPASTPHQHFRLIQPSLVSQREWVREEPIRQ